MKGIEIIGRKAISNLHKIADITKESDTHTETFNDGDQEPDDFETKTTIIQEGDAMIEQGMWICRLPIGLEYKFTKNKNWAFRIGVIPSFRRRSTEHVVKITNPKTETTIVKFVDGTADTTIIRDPFSPKHQEESYDFVQETYHTYGIGWETTNNLQVDLLAFLAGDYSILDLATYQNLRSSINLKF